MTCPKCHTELQTLEVLDKYHEVIKLAKCPHCGSFWLDEHELSRLDGQTVEEIDTANPAETQEQDLPVDCPRCHIPMEKAIDHKHNDAPVQICHECHGIFMARSYLAQYFGVKAKMPSHMPDESGVYSSRDHILVGIISVMILLFGAALAIGKQTDYFSLSADEVMQASGPQQLALYLFIALTIIIFIIGLILTFSRKNRTFRLLGWSSILLSISFIFFLSI